MCPGGTQALAMLTMSCFLVFWRSTQLEWGQPLRNRSFLLLTQALIPRTGKAKLPGELYQRNLFYKSTFCLEHSKFWSCWIKMTFLPIHLPRISNTTADITSNKHGGTLFSKYCFSSVVSAISPYLNPLDNNRKRISIVIRIGRAKTMTNKR